MDDSVDVGANEIGPVFEQLNQGLRSEEWSIVEKTLEELNRLLSSNPFWFPAKFDDVGIDDYAAFHIRNATMQLAKQRLKIHRFVKKG